MSSHWTTAQEWPSEVGGMDVELFPCIFTKMCWSKPGEKNFQMSVNQKIGVGENHPKSSIY